MLLFPNLQVPLRLSRCRRFFSTARAQNEESYNRILKFDHEDIFSADLYLFILVKIVYNQDTTGNKLVVSR